MPGLLGAKNEDRIGGQQHDETRYWKRAREISENCRYIDAADLVLHSLFELSYPTMLVVRSVALGT